MKWPTGNAILGCVTAIVLTAIVMAGVTISIVYGPPDTAIARCSASHEARATAFCVELAKKDAGK